MGFDFRMYILAVAFNVALALPDYGSDVLPILDSDLDLCALDLEDCDDDNALLRVRADPNWTPTVEDWKKHWGRVGGAVFDVGAEVSSQLVDKSIQEFRMLTTGVQKNLAVKAGMESTIGPGVINKIGWKIDAMAGNGDANSLDTRSGVIGFGCFASDAKVILRSGPTSIANVRIGDELLGFDHATGTVQFTKLRMWFHRSTESTISLIRLTTDVGDITTTAEHNLAVDTPHTYAFARDIRPGSSLVTPLGTVVVRSSSQEIGHGAYAPLTWTSNFYVGLGEGMKDSTATFLAHSYASFSNPGSVESSIHALLSMAEYFWPSINDIEDDSETDYLHPVGRLCAWMAGIDLPV